MVAELQRTVRVCGGLARRRAERARSATGRPSRAPRAARLLLALAALGMVVAVSLGVAAARSPAEEINRLIAPADVPMEWIHRA